MGMKDHNLCIDEDMSDMRRDEESSGKAGRGKNTEVLGAEVAFWVKYKSIPKPYFVHINYNCCTTLGRQFAIC